MFKLYYHYDTVYPLARYYRCLLQDLALSLARDCAAVIDYYTASSPAVNCLILYCNQIRLYSRSAADYDPQSQSVSDLDHDAEQLSILYDAYFSEHVVRDDYYKPDHIQTRLSCISNNLVAMLSALKSFSDHLYHCRDSILIL